MIRKNSTEDGQVFMRLRNYVKEGQKLPMFGIGPFLIYGMIALNAAVILSSYYIFKSGIAEGIYALIFRAAGAVLIALGIVIWAAGSIFSGMDESITENMLNTSGIYSWVRNPMYTGCWFFITGIGFMWHNYWSLPMVIIDWMIMTVVLINTEEKWLSDLYGDEYAAYKKRVNRCIPWRTTGVTTK